MKKLNNTEAELKKALLIKKRAIVRNIRVRQLVNFII